MLTLIMEEITSCTPVAEIFGCMDLGFVFSFFLSSRTLILLGATMSSAEKLLFPAFFVARDGHMTQFRPMRYKQKPLGGAPWEPP